MSSVDDSDDEFESADEDIDFESKLEADAEEEERRGINLTVRSLTVRRSHW